MGDRNRGHLSQVAVEHLGELLGFEGVREIRKPDHVGEQNRQLPTFEPVIHRQATREQSLRDLVRHEPLELAGPDQLGHLLLDPRLQETIQPVDLLDVLSLKVVQSLLHQSGPHTCAEEHRVDRLGQVVIGAELDASNRARDVVDRGDHHYRQMSQPGVVLQPLEDLVPVDLRHNDVQQDHVEALRAHEVERLGTALDRGDLVSVRLQASREHRAVHGIIVDDEHGRAVVHGSSSGARRSSSSSVRSSSAARRSTVWMSLSVPARAEASTSRQISVSADAPNIAALDFSVWAATRTAS
ncbi:MAG TPA: hypothetical protein VJ774_00005 [Actinomycetota bacterium]|nr:hypothetical protein [Actinomycetota bacterium]